MKKKRTRKRNQLKKKNLKVSLMKKMTVKVKKVLKKRNQSQKHQNQKNQKKKNGNHIYQKYQINYIGHTIHHQIHSGYQSMIMMLVIYMNVDYYLIVREHVLLLLIKLMNR
jgi:hypothetical protein